MPTASWTRVVIAIAAALAAAALFVNGTKVSLDWYKALLSVSGAVVLLLLVFDRWAWRWPVVRRLIPRRVVHGTWKGELQTSWSNPASGQTPGPIECYLVVHQTYSTVEMALLTAESKSRSVTAGMSDPAKGQCLLTGIYMNTPDLLIQDRSRIHRGGILLEINGRPVETLDGFYWTDRDTKGQLTFEQHVGKVADDFRGARALLP